MGKFLIGCGLLLCTSCTPYRGLVNEARVEQTRENCAKLLDGAWIPMSAPPEAAELVTRVVARVRPLGYMWYAAGPDKLAACGYIDDPDGCGFSAHEFTRAGGTWSYQPGSWQDAVCVAD